MAHIHGGYKRGAPSVSMVVALRMLKCIGNLTSDTAGANVELVEVVLLIVVAG